MERSFQGTYSGFIWLTAAMIASALVAALFCQPAYAVTAAEKEAEAQEALTQLHAMQDTLEKASSKYYTSLAEYQQAVELRDATQKKIKKLSAEIADIQANLGSRARDMYRSGSSSFLDLLFGAASFEEFTNNWDMLMRLNASEADLVKRQEKANAEYKEKKKTYDEQATVAEQKSTEASEAYKESKKLVKQMEETYKSLSSEAQKLYEQEQAAAAEAAAAAAAEAAAAAAQPLMVADGATAQTAASAEDAFEQAYDDAGIQNEDGTVTDAETGEVYKDAASYSEATGNEVVDRAMSMLGASYQYGGTGADGSFDCSGLVGYALTGSYERIGNTTTFMGYNQVSDPQPGDICVNDGHTGIYIGDGQMVHASDENTGVVVGDVQSGMIYVRP